ncbi:MAG: hypothetical protein FJ304_16715 [Planctomycetes bacterium]|nr:hypothetical protein [Planctomycetota bacterium]
MNRVLAALAVVVLGAGAARADVTVTNKAPGTIEVKVGNGSKTEIKSGEKVVFNTNAGEHKLAVFASGSEKASSTVKNNSKVIVTHKNGVWTIANE